MLQAPIDSWQSPVTATDGLGAIDPASWQASIAFMATRPDGLVPNPVSVDQIVTPDLLPPR